MSPRLTGEGSGRRRIGGESGRRLGDGGPGGRLGDSTLRFGGDRFRGGEAGFFRGDDSLGRCWASFSALLAPLSFGGASLFGGGGTFVGDAALWRGCRVNLNLTTFPSI